jgi:hypothetical protein
MIRHTVMVGCVLMGPVVGRAQQQAQSGFIAGEVRDSAGSTVSYVDVVVLHTRLHAAVDSAGRFLITDVSPGKYSLRVVSIGIQPLDVTSVGVTAGDTTRVGTLVVASIEPREVWLGCRAMAASSCTMGRHIVVPLGMIMKGKGVIRDQATWERLWTEGRAPEIDWTHEMVIVVSAGNDMIDAAGGNPVRVNRVVERPNSIVVVVGPDTLIRRSGCCVDGVVSPQAVVIPRSEKPVLFQNMVPLNETVPAVTW